MINSGPCPWQTGPDRFSSAWQVQPQQSCSTGDDAGSDLAQRYLGDHLFDDGTAEGLEILRHHHERAGPADDVILVIFREPPRRVRVLRVPGDRAVAQDHEAIDDDTLGD